MKRAPRIRNIYQQRTKIQLQCRACLTLSNNAMFSLDQTISIEENVSTSPEEMSVREALEKVTSSRVSMRKDYPRYICPVCLSFLKITLKFILQFEDSQKKLSLLKLSLASNEEHKEEKCSVDELNKIKSSTVEIIFGQHKYSLSDLIVVENDEKEQSDFNGFLENLGKEVTATFIDKNEDSKLHKENNSNDVTIGVIENDKLLVVKEVRLNEETEEIEYIVDDAGMKPNENISDCSSKSDMKIYDVLDINNENIKCIEIDQNNIESYIIETGNNVTEDKNKENNDLCNQKKIKVRKRRRFQDQDAFYPCDSCKKFFITFRALKAHQKRVHFRTVKEYICEICGYKNNTLSGHKHHMNKHSDKKWACSICQKRYYTKAVLKVHMESHHNRRQYLCSVCGKCFNYSNALGYHMRLHTGEKNYECHICHQRYRMPNGLKRHLLTHTGEKPYNCQFCGKPFFSRSESSAHELTHTDYRPYSCAYCNKGFVKSHNMKVHLLTHSGPYKCNICSKAFADLNILAFHYKFSHKFDYEVNNADDRERESEDFESFS